MKKNTIIWLAVGGVLLIGGVLFLVMRKPKPKDDQKDDQKDDKKDDDVKPIVSPIGTPPIIPNVSPIAGVFNLVSKFKKYEVKSEKANVRSLPSTKGQIVETYTKGKQFLGIDNGKGWITIGKGKYISKALLNEIPTAETKVGFMGVK